MIEVDVKLKIVELRAKGLSIAKVAEELGIAKQTVVDVCKDNKEEVASLYAVQLEQLYESERITATERIKALSTLASKIRAELESRELSDVPTDKLVDLYLKTLSAVDGAVIEPTFKSTQELKEAKIERDTIAALI